MALKSLIFSEDEKVVRILKVMLTELSVEVEHTKDYDAAHKCLLQQKYDGVFAECETEQGANLLSTVRKSKHNTRSIVFALSGATLKMNAAFELGAHFVIHKPLIVEKVKRTLKAAHGLMMREQRAHYRHPTATTATVKLPDGPGFTVTLRDLSQSGALLESKTRISKGQVVQLRFQLPETDIAVEAFGMVTRVDDQGRAGVHFEKISDVAQRALLQWVIEHSTEQENKPEIPALPTPPAAMSKPAVAKVETKPDHHPELEVEVVAEDHEHHDKPAPNQVRGALRAHHESPIKVLAFSEGKPVISEGVCKNVSELGLSAELKESLAVGDSVLTMITFPDVASPMVLHAQVRHREGHDHGFEFVSLPDSARSMLRTSLSELPVDAGV